MKLRRILLVAAAACAVAYGSFSLGLPVPAADNVQACAEKGQTTARCGKCGDGQCVKSCGETATSCPKDCGGVPSTSLASVER